MAALVVAFGCESLPQISRATQDRVKKLAWAYLREHRISISEGARVRVRVTTVAFAAGYSRTFYDVTFSELRAGRHEDRYDMLIDPHSGEVYVFSDLSRLEPPTPPTI